MVRNMNRPASPGTACSLVNGSVEQRVAQALARGGLNQWIRFDTAAEVAAASTLLRQAGARHVEALTGAQIDARHAERLAAIPSLPARGTPGPVPPALAAE